MKDLWRVMVLGVRSVFPKGGTSYSEPRYSILVEYFDGSREVTETDSAGLQSLMEVIEMPGQSYKDAINDTLKCAPKGDRRIVLVKLKQRGITIIPCPTCSKLIDIDSKKCPHCGSRIY